MQKDIRLALAKEYEVRVQRNPKYSMRSFAAFLNMDPTQLRRFLIGERNLGRKYLNNISSKLNLSIELKQAMQKKILSHKPVDKIDLKDAVGITDWYHFTIGEWIRIQKKTPDVATTAKALSISHQQCQQAIDDILKSGAVKVKESGLVETLSSYVNALHKNLPGTLLRIQENILKKASESLRSPQASKNIHSGMALAIDSTYLPMIEAEIENLKRKISEMTKNSKKPDAIYNMQISFFRSMGV